VSSWITESTPKAWDERARAGGPDHVVADCGSPESHERRLRAVLRLPIEPGDSLIELGCGTGRLADLLPDGVHYEGIDWSSAVIDEARARRSSLSFRVGGADDLGEADWIVASGPYNYEHGWSKPQTAAAIERMWRNSRRGIAVTVLRVPAEGRLHYEPLEMARFLDGQEWAQLQLDRSYLPNDLCLRAWRG
jgi:SAM-dependent methyltransferase